MFDIQRGGTVWQRAAHFNVKQSHLDGRSPKDTEEIQVKMNTMEGTVPPCTVPVQSILNKYESLCTKILTLAH